MTAASPVKLPHMPTVKRHAADHELAAKRWSDLAAAQAIETPRDYRTAAAAAAAVKRQLERIELLRRSWIEGLATLVRAINNLFKPTTETLEATEKTLKTKMIAFLDEHGPCPVDGVQVRTTWVGKLVDAELVPDQYWIVDESQLQALTRARGDDPKIPGWEAKPARSIAITAGAEPVAKETSR